MTNPRDILKTARAVGAAAVTGLALAACTGTPLTVEGPHPPGLPPADGVDLVFDIGRGAAEPGLGFGWSRKERGASGRFRWVKRMEADVTVELDRVADAELWVRLAPLYLEWRRQRVALYVNDAIAAEWTCPKDPAFYTYRAAVPARFWKEGANRLTFRAGYMGTHRSDKRSLAFAVDTLALDFEG